MLAIFSKVFAFFASDKTPNSSFYVTVGTIIASLIAVLSSSTNPVLMTIGGVLAAIYTIANNYTEARKTQAAADAFNTTLHASIRMPAPTLPMTGLTPEAAADVANRVVETARAAAAEKKA